MELVLPKLRRGVESVRMHLAFSKLLSSGKIGSRSSLRYLFCCLPVLNQPIESLQSLAPLRPMVSMPVHLKVSNDLVLKNFAGWSRRSLTLPLAAVSLLAAAVAEATRASCEPEFSPSTNKKTEILEEEAIKQYINELWRHLEDRMHGLSAGKPEGNAAQSLGEPSVSVTQGRMEIAADIPQNLNIEASVSHIRRLLRQSQANTNSWSNEGGIHYTASISETSSSGPRGTARRLHKSSSNQNETVEIEVMEPFDKGECVRFEFRGPATAETLQLVAGSLEEAFRPSSNRGGRSSPLGTLFDSLIRGDEFNQRGESEIEPFLGPLWELMHELQRHHLESESSLESWLRGQDESETLPFKRPPELPQKGGRSSALADEQDPAVRSSIRKLEQLGCQVFLPSKELDKESDKYTSKNPVVDWGQLAGYNEQKQTIEESLLLPLMRPEVYDEVARGTRDHFQSNRPRAVLFVGPPGTGKTTSARVISSQACVPLVYIPLEALVSKWYGESEKSLASALEAADGFPEGCIIFLDELDSLATTRSGEMHEATRRILGVLLRHIDGFDSKKRSIVVGATNRPQDLDPALRSRFSTIISFELPGEEYRRAILRKYAHHLKDAEIQALASATPGMAGRDLKDLCEQAERIWAAAIIRGEASSGGLPPFNVYLKAARARLKEMTVPEDLY